MESWILRVSCKVSEALGFTFTLQEPRSIHGSMNIPKMNLLLTFTFYYKYLKYKKSVLNLGI